MRVMSKDGKDRYIQIASPDILDILKKDYNHNASEINKSVYLIEQKIMEHSPIKSQIKYVADKIQARILRVMNPKSLMYR